MCAKYCNVLKALDDRLSNEETVCLSNNNILITYNIFSEFYLKYLIKYKKNHLTNYILRVL